MYKNNFFVAMIIFSRMAFHVPIFLALFLDHQRRIDFMAARATK